MKSKIIKYIETEKKLSEHKISMLKNINKDYAKRIVSKEKDFIKFNFNIILNL